MRENEKGSEMKGLPAQILKFEGRSYSGGGISSTADEVTIVGIIQAAKPPRDENIEPVFEEARVFEPRAEAPPVVIVNRTGMPSYAAPAIVEGDTIKLLAPSDRVGPMSGGCWLDGDSRLDELTGRAGPVSLHDRFETPAQYASYD